MPTTIIGGDERIELNFSVLTVSGGKTGSARIKDTVGDYYQYKPSIEKKSFNRRVKAGFSDKENFAELLAARIAKALDDDKESPRIPSVHFVLDDHSPHVAIVSRYLKAADQSIVPSLDDYLTKPAKTNHIKLVAAKANPQQGIYHIDEFPELKRELAAAVATSILVGDHDINPGNMVAIKQGNGTYRLGRIDFGHAFNDLMRYPYFGGHRVHRNHAIDFFNRDTVDGLNAQSKLWRDYPGLIPSHEMVSALRTLVNKEDAAAKIAQAIVEVKSEVEAILAQPHIDKRQVVFSFQSIAEHISGEKIPSNYSLNQKIAVIFDMIQHHIEQNRMHMNYAASIMELQIGIRDAMSLRNVKQLRCLKEDYLKLIQQGKENGPFSWIKETEGEPAFVGDFDAYATYSDHKNKLKQVEQHIEEFLNSQSPAAEKKIMRALQDIIKHPKKSIGSKIVALRKELDKLDSLTPTSNWFTAIITFIIRLVCPLATNNSLDSPRTNSQTFFTKKLRDIVVEDSISPNLKDSPAKKT